MDEDLIRVLKNIEKSLGSIGGALWCAFWLGLALWFFHNQ